MSMRGRDDLTPEAIEAPDPVEATLGELERWEERLAYLRQLHALLRCAAAEAPPDGQSPPDDPAPKEKTGAQPQAPAPFSHPSTAAAPLSSGEARRA